MRAPFFLLLLVGASAAAAGQQESLPKVTVDVGAFAAPISPLAGVAAADVLVTVDCALVLAKAPGQAQVAVGVAEAPRWAQATVSPADAVLAPSDCRGTNVTVPTRLLLSVTAEAPAFSPAEIAVVANVSGPTPASGRGTTPVQAAYFSILDVSGPSIFVTDPRVPATCPMTVANLGNANTKVEFTVDAQAAGWDVQPPLPVTLESRQQGGTETSATVALTVVPRQDGLYVNEVGAFTVNVSGHYALDATVRGDATTRSCLVTVRGPGGVDAPAPAWAGAVGAILLAAAARFRASRQHP